MNNKTLIAVSFGLSLLSGCLAMPEVESTKKRTEDVLDIVSEHQKSKRYIISNTPYVDSRPVYHEVSNNKWLEDIDDVSIVESANSEGVPLHEVIKQLKAHGVNISTMLPTQLYTYKGFSISKTNALTALEIICSSMDLDFEVRKDTGRYFVEIMPMKTSQYTLNVPNRTVSFALSDDAFSGNVSLKDLLSGGGQGASNQSQPETSNESDSRTETTIKNEFWHDLKVELNGLLTRYVPTTNSGHNPNGAQHNQGFEFMKPVIVGAVTINKTTGHISIQAPSHVRKGILSYLKQLDRQLNTRIEINGKIVIVSESEDSKKGLDISSFIEFGKDYGVVMSNDIYNQISIKQPVNAGDYFSAAVDGGFGNALGIVGNGGLLQVFNAYVDSNANIKTVYDPKLSGTSGSVSSYSRVTPYIFTNFQSGSVTNESTTTQTEQNNLVPIDFGITISAYPIYSPEKDLVRTYIDLTQVFQSSVQNISQSINGEIVTTSIPIPDKVTIKTEVVGKSGALIIVGGQDVETFEGALQGVPSLKDSIAGGLFGSSEKRASKSKYYFVFEAKAVDPLTSQL